jgi:hypothetical protein
MYFLLQMNPSRELWAWHWSARGSLSTRMGQNWHRVRLIYIWSTWVQTENYSSATEAAASFSYGYCIGRKGGLTATSFSYRHYTGCKGGPVPGAYSAIFTYANTCDEPSRNSFHSHAIKPERHKNWSADQFAILLYIAAHDSSTWPRHVPSRVVTIQVALKQIDFLSETIT